MALAKGRYRRPGDDEIGREQLTTSTKLTERGGRSPAGEKIAASICSDSSSARKRLDARCGNFPFSYVHPSRTSISPAGSSSSSDSVNAERKVLKDVLSATTSTIKELVVGSALDFEERGARTLKGAPGEWRLFAVT